MNEDREVLTTSGTYMEMLIRNGEANIDSDDEVDLFNVQTDRHER
jgi:hypothetical protein